MKRTLLSLFLSALLLSSCSNNKDSKEKADDVNDETVSNKLEEDAEFLVDAADDGMLEVMLGELAVKNGVSPKIKELGQMMVDDHSKANEELKALAVQKNIAIPTSLSEESQKEYDDIAKKTGADFDKEYADEMVENHDEALKEFKEAADDAKDADIKSWAAGKVAALQHHLDMAKAAKEAH